MAALVLAVALGVVYLAKNKKSSSPESSEPTPLPTTRAITQIEAPTQFEDSSTWPVYTNHTYNYQVSYPSDWIIDNNAWLEEVKPVDELLRFWSKSDYTQDITQPKLRADLAVMVIEVLEISEDETIRSIALEKDMPPDQTTTKLLRDEDIIISGLPAKKYTFRNDYAQWSPIYLKKENLLFHIQLDRGEAIDELKFSATVEKLLASIKFL